MIIQEFTSQDQERFRCLSKEFYVGGATLRPYNEEISLKTFKRVLDHHENLWGYLFYDKENGDAIGYALVTSYWCNEEGGEVILIDELYISPKNRQKGYAKIFMEWLETTFKDKVAITLEVLTTNIDAKMLYDKAGYQPDGFVTYTKFLRKD
ncbi:MAG: GNAT family N-acetyltransferase [Erysipelotrichaceae bacterium]|nr:GNAT family N-acetyltransferase [Erysipelotrichaceae bacterium]